MRLRSQIAQTIETDAVWIGRQRYRASASLHPDHDDRLRLSSGRHSDDWRRVTANMAAIVSLR
jgi:hypothetical protein